MLTEYEKSMLVDAFNAAKSDISKQGFTHTGAVVKYLVPVVESMVKAHNEWSKFEIRECLEEALEKLNR